MGNVSAPDCSDWHWSCVLPVDMHGSLFAPIKLFLCADCRPEPAFVITRCVSFDTDLSPPTIPVSSLGYLRYPLDFLLFTFINLGPARLCNDAFTHQLTIRAYPLSHFQLSPVTCCQYFFRNPFFYFLDKQHVQFNWENCVVLAYNHVKVVVFTRTRFVFPILPLASTYLRMSTCGCLAVDFPGYKVGHMFL